MLERDLATGANLRLVTDGRTDRRTVARRNRPSVCPSVCHEPKTNDDRIAQFLPSVAQGLFLAPKFIPQVTREHRTLVRLQTSLGWIKTTKNAEFRPINRYVSEIIEGT